MPGHPECRCIRRHLGEGREFVFICSNCGSDCDLGACVSKAPPARVGTISSGSRLAAPLDVAAGFPKAEYPHGRLGACACGHRPAEVDGIYQLTGDPDMRLDGPGDKYIGYESVGSAYEGERWRSIEPEAQAATQAIAKLAAGWPTLDIGCGSGAYAVPLAMSGCKVVAGDISNQMLLLLRARAVANGCDLANLILCRMNALAIPLADSSVGCAMVNSVLHLISNPQRVIEEIYRVLRPGGAVVLSVNSPGLDKGVAAEIAELNREAYAIIGEFDGAYWAYLQPLGFAPSKLSWEFDQFSACRDTFGAEETIVVPFSERRTAPLSDGFLARMGSRGFSAQQGLPEAAHCSALEAATKVVAQAHGAEFAATQVVHVVEGIELRVYRKPEADGSARIR